MTEHQDSQVVQRIHLTLNFAALTDDGRGIANVEVHDVELTGLPFRLELAPGFHQGAHHYVLYVLAVVHDAGCDQGVQLVGLQQRDSDY